MTTATKTVTEYKVADLSQAEFGRKELDLAEVAVGVDYQM